MYLDVKDKHCSEYKIVKKSINPAMICTNDEKHANKYAVYVIDERACMRALLHEPRFLCMSAATAKVDLMSNLTSDNVKKIARAYLNDPKAEAVAMLTVIATIKSDTFIPAKPYKVLEDGTEITTFQNALADFANVDLDKWHTSEWDEAVEQAIIDHEKKESDLEEVYINEDVPKLNRMFHEDEFDQLMEKAGVDLHKPEKGLCKDDHHWKNL